MEEVVGAGATDMLEEEEEEVVAGSGATEELLDELVVAGAGATTGAEEVVTGTGAGWVAEVLGLGTTTGGVVCAGGVAAEAVVLLPKIAVGLNLGLSWFRSRSAFEGGLRAWPCALTLWW